MKHAAFLGRPSFHFAILIFFLATIFVVTGEVSAALIPGLYNTGVNDAGDVLPDGDEDEHYDLATPDSKTSEPPIKIPENNLPENWVTAPDGSAWIGPTSGESSDPGKYSYVLTFDLKRLDPATAVLAGEWSSDNASEIFLNGNSTGFERDRIGFMSLASFEIETGFIPGLNTLLFLVDNEGTSPTGLLVADLTGTAVPIPGTVWLLGAALTAFVGIKKRLRG